MASRRKRYCPVYLPHTIKHLSQVTMSDIAVDETTLVRRGRAVLDRVLVDGVPQVPDEYCLKWTGGCEGNACVQWRLSLSVPLVPLINFAPFQVLSKRVFHTLMILLAIPVTFLEGLFCFSPGGALRKVCPSPVRWIRRLTATPWALLGPARGALWPCSGPPLGNNG